MTTPVKNESFSFGMATADPHAVNAEMRRVGPVRQVVLPDGLAVWVVTRYDEARQALTDPRLSNTRPDPGPAEERVENPAVSRHMLSSDPPDHTRLRRLISAGFTARRTEALRPRVQEITDELLDAMAGQTRLDLIDAFAFPLPIQVICELLGVPGDDRDSFRAWSNILVAGRAERERVPAALESMATYILELIASKRAQPADDLLSALIDITEGSDRLSDQELSGMVFLLLIAGHETTVNLIGNGIFLLLREPQRWDRLRADPGLLPTAIEEFLRYESPVQTTTFRVTTAPVELGGQLIPADQPVLVSLQAANRDERQFGDAEQVDLGRDHNQHLAFGHGIHYCLGAPLARLEAQVAFASLMARYPGLRLAVPENELSWRTGILMRGLTHLPVTL